MASPTGYALEPNEVLYLQRGMERWGGRRFMQKGTKRTKVVGWLCGLCDESYFRVLRPAAMKPRA